MSWNIYLLFERSARYFAKLDRGTEVARRINSFLEVKNILSCGCLLIIAFPAFLHFLVAIVCANDIADKKVVAVSNEAPYGEFPTARRNNFAVDLYFRQT